MGPTSDSNDSHSQRRTIPAVRPGRPQFPYLPIWLVLFGFRSGGQGGDRQLSSPRQPLPHGPSEGLPPLPLFTPSSPGAVSQEKESLGSDDEDGCVIDSAPSSPCPYGRKLKDHLLRGASPQVRPPAGQSVSVKRMLL